MGSVVDMTEGGSVGHILKLAFPLMLTNIGQQLYMIADAAIVGRGVGVQALAAVGATDWSYWLVLWTVTGLTQAFATFVSRFFGDKDYASMNKTIVTAIVLCVLIGGFLTMAGLLASRSLLELLHTPADIVDAANTYLSTMIGGTVIVMAYNLAASILRALGDGKSPLVAMVIAALLNVGLDLLFVFPLEMGVFGAALASVLSQLVSFLYCLLCLRQIACVDVGKKSWQIDGSLVKKMVLFGVPIAVQYIIIAVGGIVLQSSINQQGSLFIAGYTATNKVYGLLESSAIALGLACSTFFAQNYGARKYLRVRKGLTASIKIVVLLAAATTTIALLARNHLLKLFLNVGQEGGQEALSIGVEYLTIMSSCLVILFMLHVYRNVLQAMAIAKWSMISGLVECAARITMAKVAIHWIGSKALFVSEPAAWLGALLSVMLPYYYYRKKKLMVE